MEDKGERMPETGESQHKLKLENYYGPLDLLLQLVKEDELDVLGVRLTEVIEQYVAFLEAAKDMNMDLAAEFIVVSSQLMLLKSRRVVPAMTPQDEDADEEEEEISIDLIRRLLQYKKFKDLAQGLAERQAEMSRRHGRPVVRISSSDGELPEVDLWKLVKAFARLSQQVRLAQDLSIIYQDIPIEKIITRILSRIRDRSKMTFKELIGDTSDRPQVIGNLLAMLELVKRQVLDYKAGKDGEITLSLTEGEPEPE
jgi:segregation and condensation protein A